MTVSLLALAASYRDPSLNRSLLKEAAASATLAGATVTTLDYKDCDAPLYRGEPEALPPGARRLADALLAHDGLLLAAPEYNWSIPGALKNLIDWLSIDKRQPLKGRTALLMCASPSMRGGICGLQQLRVPLELLGMWVAPQMMAIGAVRDTLVLRDRDAQYLQQTVQQFISATEALAHVR